MTGNQPPPQPHWKPLLAQTQLSLSYAVTDAPLIQSSPAVVVRPDHVVVRFMDRQFVGVSIYGRRVLKSGQETGNYAVHGLSDKRTWPDWLFRLVEEAKKGIEP